MRRSPTVIVLGFLLLLAAPVRAQDAAAPAPAEAPAPRPAASPPEEPELGMALLFSLNNVLVDSSVLGGYRGLGVGFQMELNSQWSLRAGLDASRLTNPPRVLKVTSTVGSDTVTTYTLDVSSPTTRYGAVVTADLIRRLGRRALAPYVGAGLGGDWTHAETVYTDDITIPEQVTQVDDLVTSQGLVLQGILGMAWRVHESISLYAEYNLGVGIVRWTFARSQSTVAGTSGGVESTRRTRSEGTDVRWLNLDLGLGQGASLGLMAHF